MTERLKAMRRVLAVQSQVKRLAEWQLIALETRKRELAASGRDLDGFIDQGDLSGDLAVLGLRQRRRLAAREREAEAARAVQAEVTRQACGREKLAERMVDGLAADHRRETERRDLAQLIEAITRRFED